MFDSFFDKLNRLPRERLYKSILLLLGALVCLGAAVFALFFWN